MNRVLFLSLGLLTAGIQAQAQTAQTFVVPLSQPEQRVTLDVELVNGSIEVIGERRNDVQFEATAKSGRQRIITPSGSVPINNPSFELDVTEEDNRVKVDTDSYRNAINLVIRVPVDTDLEASTVNSGKVTVSNLNGHLVLGNVNGPITATGLRGTVLAETVNGDVEIELLEIDRDKPMSLGSINGELKMGLPSDFNGTIRVDSGNDEIFSDFDIEILPTEPSIKRNSDHGHFKISLSNEIRGRIGNGSGPEITFKTLHGRVSINKSN